MRLTSQSRSLAVRNAFIMYQEILDRESAAKEGCKAIDLMALKQASYVEQ